MHALLLAVLAFSTTAEAGKKKKDKVDPDHTNYFQSVEVSAGDVRIETVDAWAKTGEFKAKLIHYAPADAWVVVPKGNAALHVGDLVARDEDRGVKKVAPGGKVAVVHAIEDEGGRLHVEALDLQPASVRSITIGGPTIEVPPAAFPESSRIPAGPFSCEVKGKPTRATDLLRIKMECTYSGEQAGIVDPGAVKVGIIDGSAFANEANAKPLLLLPGEKATFPIKNTSIQPGPHKVDLQFDSVHLIFEGALRERPVVEHQVPAIKLTLDPELTASKN